MMENAANMYNLTTSVNNEFTVEISYAKKNAAQLTKKNF